MLTLHRIYFWLQKYSVDLVIILNLNSSGIDIGNGYDNYDDGHEVDDDDDDEEATD